MRRKTTGRTASPTTAAFRSESADAADFTDPLAPVEEPDEPSDLDGFDATGPDDELRWDAFIPDDDEYDPLPAPGDFWVSTEREVRIDECD